MATAGATAIALAETAAASSSPQPAPTGGERRRSACTAATYPPVRKATTVGSTMPRRPYSRTRLAPARAAADSSAAARPSGPARPTASSSTARAVAATESERPTASVGSVSRNTRAATAL
jgi:hypothetical protein